eukprot:1157086-Pelagomonas_calceolata.AAC.6
MPKEEPNAERSQMLKEEPNAERGAKTQEPNAERGAKPQVGTQEEGRSVCAVDLILRPASTRPPTLIDMHRAETPAVLFLSLNSFVCNQGGTEAEAAALQESIRTFLWQSQKTCPSMCPCDSHASAVIQNSARSDGLLNLNELTFLCFWPGLPPIIPPANTYYQHTHTHTSPASPCVPYIQHPLVTPHAALTPSLRLAWNSHTAQAYLDVEHSVRANTLLTLSLRLTQHSRSAHAYLQVGLSVRAEAVPHNQLTQYVSLH